MSISRTQHRPAWRVVERLDDRGGPPPDESSSGGGGGRDPLPLWTTHLLAFVAGGIVWGALLILPVAAPLMALVFVIGFAAYALRRDTE